MKRKMTIIIALVLNMASAGILFAQMGPGMMGGWGGPWSPRYQLEADPLTLEQAEEATENYLALLGDQDLVLAEVMEFAYNFYAEVEEKSTGIHAFELLVDRYTGSIYPEPGPNMMWNIKYGHMGGYGMMGGPRGGLRRYNQQTPTSDMPISQKQALDYAQRFLDYRVPGVQVAHNADRFYGYYTIHVLKGNEIFGMLSVNGYTGQVWYHTWHGEFIAMKEYE